eukprot:TRINITY_DN9392_c0_g1_i1.p1 TRINITY_DN9392_c0_g1~~TRINITY_DN9392_c0_g1_i1.p1  ORF type:complete len:168 (+),score=25.34 TRINITY_DN9392_c0_g1_i1:87-590(+)
MSSQDGILESSTSFAQQQSTILFQCFVQLRSCERVPFVFHHGFSTLRLKVSCLGEIQASREQNIGGYHNFNNEYMFFKAEFSACDWSVGQAIEYLSEQRIKIEAEQAIFSKDMKSNRIIVLGSSAIPIPAIRRADCYLGLKNHQTACLKMVIYEEKYSIIENGYVKN